jgi:hypothetical protein
LQANKEREALQEVKTAAEVHDVQEEQEEEFVQMESKKRPKAAAARSAPPKKHEAAEIKPV